jgi:hypothetical protein
MFSKGSQAMYENQLCPCAFFCGMTVFQVLKGYNPAVFVLKDLLVEMKSSFI